MSSHQVCPCEPFAPAAPLAPFTKASRVFVLLILLCALVGGSVLSAQAATEITFTAEELLGKPTNNSVTINIVPNSTIEYHYQYRPESESSYSVQTGNSTATAGQPHEIDISGLVANTKYYYRMRYHAPGDGPDDWFVRPEHSFWTQRAPGSEFTFTVTSDSHQNFNAAEQNAMTNILNEHPDFNIDLGDTFLLDGSADQAAVINKYLAYREPLYFDKIGGSVPIFLTPGNHEDEEGWNLDDSFSLALASIQARKLFYPTPIDQGVGGFYSGNTDILADIDAGTYGDQYREDYYAWTWGDALFVVIDEFQYTMHNPYGAVAGEGSDDSKTCDYTNDPNCQWNWTLGAQQYQWFKETLENSSAKYKFIFSHNMLGGKLTVAPSTGQPGYVRGGCEAAPYFEWGGKNADGTEGFADRRTATYGASAVPLRQLMMDNGVSAYFHGHDHQYVYETCDSMVYQEVPSPGMSPSGFAEYTEGDHGSYQTVKVLPNSGHLRITVTPAQATVDYISSASGTNGTVNYSYTIAPNVVADPDYFITATAGANGSISPSGVVGVVAGADQSFTITPNAGYEVADVLVDDVSQGAVATYTFEDVAADHTISASFSALPQYTITAIAGANGSISPSGAVIVTEGSNQSFSITPIGGYQVADVLVDGVSAGAVVNYEFSDIQANHTIEVSFEEGAAGVVTLDGAASSTTGNSVSSIIINHTTGTGANRLLLVGVSWNCGDTGRSISSVTFTPSGGSATALSLVKTQQAGTQLRYSAIYSLLNPPSGQAGTVTVTFSGSVGNGIVAGAANFAGVNQTTPLGTAAGAGSTSQGTAATVTLTGLGGSELVFDNLFMGGSADTQTVTPGAGQSAPLWNGFAGNARGAASTEQAAGSSVTMSWTASESAYWAIAAVPINPAAAGATYNLTMATDGHGTTTPAVGVHNYAEDAVVTISATPNSGYIFGSWTGDADCADGSVTMNANKTCTANFTTAPAQVTFTGQELLGRPTDTSISVKVVPDSPISLYYEYGTTPGVYTGQTDTVAAPAGAPTTVIIGCLSPDTKYYYRMQYSADGGTSWVSRPEHSFWTQRAPGSTFTFDITTDSHINIQLGNQSNWTSTMNGVAADAPDFLLDLGDTFAMDNGSTSVALGDTAAAEQKYKDALPTFNIASGSTPIFLTEGNHEQQEAWHLTASNTGGDPAISLPVMSKNAEKKYFLNPVPDSFYAGNTATHPNLSGDQLKQDYYAWTWGDALFVVISPYWTTSVKPYTTTAGGGETDTTGSGERWDWTLGLDQFNWLKTTLQNSDAKYKFVFSHQIVGGNGMTSPVNQVNYGHGGVDSANFVEWGGYNIDGTTYNWSTKRSGWDDQPIRQMMEANGVTAFFHGHDHQMAYESLNGMVYQAVPSGSFTGSFGLYTTGGNSGNTIWADSTQGPGRLRVTVGPTQATVDFIRYNATSPAYTYTISPPGGVTPDGAVSSGTSAPTASSVAFDHTTGTGTNRLMLVGVSWNCGTTNRTISTATFTPDGGSALPLTEVRTQQYNWSTSYRYTAIYSLPNPDSGVSGEVSITFSGAVANGIIAGAANFAGVDQTTPLGTPNGAVGTGTSTSGTPNPSVTLTGLTGNELIFDSVFIGASNTSHTLTAGSGQSALWNILGYTSGSSFNVRGAASTKQTAGVSAIMSWTTGGYDSTETRWAIAAVPIKPAPVSSYDLTVAVDGVGSTTPEAGVHSYAPNTDVNVTATPMPGTGYVFSHWTGACTGSGACSITMNADKSVTAHFVVSVGVTISKSGNNPKLDWPHEAALVESYAVYRSLTNPYFVLSNASRLPVEVSAAAPTFTDTTADLSVAGNMYFYLVGPVNDCGGACGYSNRTGAFVYGLVPGTSTP